MGWKTDKFPTDTGQLYVSTDGENFTPLGKVCDCSFGINLWIKEPTTATESLEREERIRTILEYLKNKRKAEEDAVWEPFEIEREDFQKYYPAMFTTAFYRNIRDIRNNTEKETKKMEAKKCNRCGKLYEVSNFADTNDRMERMNVRFRFHEIDPETAKGLNDVGIAERQMGTVKIIGVGYMHEVDIDICPECRAAFKNWWENPNPDKEDK